MTIFKWAAQVTCAIIEVKKCDLAAFMHVSRTAPVYLFLDYTMNAQQTRSPSLTANSTAVVEAAQRQRDFDFATEVKAERLDLLWKLVLAGALVTLSLALIAISVDDSTASLWIFTPIVLVIASLLTRYMLGRERITAAARVFSLGGIVAVAAALYTTDSVLLQVVPFAFTVVVFISGLMLSPSSMIYVTLLAVGAIVGIPWLVIGDLSFFGGHQFFAIGLLMVAAGLAAQVTGELYRVTQWALDNYRRERSTNDALFESRRALERSLKRSEALSDSLKAINAELEEARAAAEAAKHFRGQFLANMSHELRTPLNAIIGFSETMMKFPIMYDNTPMPQVYQNDLGQIFNGGQQLLTLINDILDLARIDAGKLEVVSTEMDLQPVLHTVMATVNGLLAGKPITLNNTLPDPLPTLYADPNRVRQVLINLFSNAVKFTNMGEVGLTIRKMEAGVQFSVYDTGIGIAPENQALIFEEFKQANAGLGRDPRAGSGLGLAITRQLVTLMNGRVWVESTLGKGSTFHVLLPAEAPPRSAETASALKETTG